jgi:hypothetical protein
MLTESNSVGPGGSGYSYNSYKAVEYMMNFETGSYQVLTKSLFEEYLIADDELYKEYKKTKKNWREKMYMYINKYNQKYPVYIPVHRN